MKCQLDKNNSVEKQKGCNEQSATEKSSKLNKRVQTYNLLKEWKEQVRCVMKDKSVLLPLFNFEKKFDFYHLKYRDQQKNQISLTPKSLLTLARLLEIVQIVMKLLQSQQSITKRNLYYKLVTYYQYQYQLIDLDLELLTLNLKITREQLQIFSSTRCLIFGKAVILSQDQHQQLRSRIQIISNVPIITLNTVINTNCYVLVIVEKESAMYQIHQQIMKNHEIQQQLDHLLFITSKGYPESTTKNFISLILPKIEQIYFLGDSDIYGLDILLNYSIAYKQWPSLVSKILWVQLQTLLPQKRNRQGFLSQNKQDKIKGTAILERSYFKQIETFLPCNLEEENFKQKIQRWKQKGRKMLKSNVKIELESIFKQLPKGWIIDALKPESCI